MKKIVYLAPALLLGLVGKGVMADQNTHISHLDAGLMTSLNEPQQDQAANANKSQQEQVAQNKNVKINEIKKATTHISSLDSNIIEDNAKANETNEIKHTASTNADSLANNNTENSAKAVRYNNFSVRTNTETASNFIESKVANNNSDQHTIRNPNNNQIIIHYVDENGKSIAGLKDYTININNAPKGNSTGQFQVPDNRYVLPDPTSDYQLQHNKHTVHHDAVTHIVHHEEQGYYTTEEVPDGTYTTSIRNTDGGQTYIDQTEGRWIPSSATPDGSGGYTEGTLTYTPNYTEQQEWVQTSPAYDETVVDKPAYDETIGNNVFSDNSKNIKSVIGNTVNVILKHGTRNVDANNSDIELDSWRKLHAINSDNQSNLTNESVKFKVGYTLDLVSSAKVADLASYKAVSNPNDFISENNLTSPVGFSAINNKLLSISL